MYPVSTGGKNGRQQAICDAWLMPSLGALHNTSVSSGKYVHGSDPTLSPPLSERITTYPADVGIVVFSMSEYR